ncbi:MAG TPA: biosynthetic-type acetolactate synthase large subunit [Clostridiales bacterium]|nr:biosynthetic-type acetolactate synthase large subunit [Clostridiales bacterium]
MLTGAQIVMECLAEQGVDTVFGYPGGAVLNIYDELYKNSHRFRHILTSHEQHAAHAADGYARVTGKTAVCIATSGPGATNLVTGIATAYMDSVPVVFITGNVSTDLIGKDSFQEADITGITLPITKNNYLVKDVNKLADVLREAFAIASSGRPGPVLVDIPKNVTAAVAEYTPKEPYKYKGPNDLPIDPESVKKLAELINSTEKIFILCGGGVIRSGASERLCELAHKLGVPVGATLMGIGGFPCTDPLYTGLVGMHGTKASNTAISECELFLAFGSRFSDRVIGDSSKFGKKAVIAHIDIDEAEINKNIRAHHHVRGPIDEVLDMLLPLVNPPEESLAARRAWAEYIGSMRCGALTSKPVSGDRKLTPKGIVDTVYAASPKDTIIVTDVGQHQIWAATYYKYVTPGTLITSGGFGTMGYGAGAAIGAKLGRPDMRVIHMTGDGSFRMNCGELATEEFYNLPIITVIFNNGTLGMVRQWQSLFYGGRYSQSTLDRGPDFVKLAEAYGIKGYDLYTTGQLAEALRNALELGKPAVLNCHIGINETVTPMVAPGKPITDFILQDIDD